MAAITPNQLRGPATTEAVRPAYRPVRPGPIATLRSTLTEILTHRRLIGYLVRADLKKRGADTFLGNVWWFLDPLLTMLVYVVLVSVILQSTQEAYPLFIFCAILPWKWFTSTMQDAAGLVTSQERLIKQLHFPKLVLPIASVFSGVMSFAFGLIPLGLLMVFFYSSRISPYLLLIPVVAFVQLVFSLGMATRVSSVNVFYRDMGTAIRYVLRIWFYLSPALYSGTQLASLGVKNPTIAFIFNLNPFTILFECYRNIIYNGTPPLWGHLAALLVFSAFLFCLATLLFKRVEPAFAKVM
jgi:lipopolysaccharide transport system permease protein